MKYIKLKSCLSIVSGLVAVGISAESAMAQVPNFMWSQGGAISGMTCVNIYESADPASWGDNYLCSDQNLGLLWSSAGPINRMRCTQVYEEADPHTWNDNYLCTPPFSPLTLSWSQAGAIPGKVCTRIYEDSDPHAWGDNFLCVDPSLPTYPIYINTEQETVGSHWYMETNATVSKNGRIDATTKVKSCQSRGFTGGVQIFLLDKDGNSLYATDPARSYGVNGKDPFGGCKDRTVPWNETVSPETMDQVVAAIVQHNYTPRDRLTPEDVFKAIELGAKIYGGSQGGQ